MYLNTDIGRRRWSCAQSLTITWDVFEWAIEKGFADTNCLTITWDVFEYLGIYAESWRNTRLTITWDVFESDSATMTIYLSSLTITWDVFEWQPTGFYVELYLFNYNMGCIWIAERKHGHNSTRKFNYNMGCIWISVCALQAEISSAFNYNMGCIWMVCQNFDFTTCAV